MRVEDQLTRVAESRESLSSLQKLCLVVPLIDPYLVSPSHSCPFESLIEARDGVGIGAWTRRYQSRICILFESREISVQLQC